DLERTCGVDPPTVPLRGGDEVDSLHGGDHRSLLRRDRRSSTAQGGPYGLGGLGRRLRLTAVGNLDPRLGLDRGQDALETREFLLGQTDLPLDRAQSPLGGPELRTVRRLEVLQA